MNSLLPLNSSALERAIEESVKKSIEDVPNPIRQLWNPETCPSALLPWLAWSLSVDNWDAGWSETVKRSMIAQSITIHRHKGTIGALRRAMKALGHGIKVTEWPEYQGQAYHFRLEVELTNRGLSEEEQAEIILTAEQTKNVRSWLESLIIYLTSQGALHYAVAMQTGDRCTVYPYAKTDLEHHTIIPMIALAIYGAETTTLYPK